MKNSVKLYRDTEEAERKFSYLLLTEARKHAIAIAKLKQEIKKKRLLAEQARVDLSEMDDHPLAWYQSKLPFFGPRKVAERAEQAAILKARISLAREKAIKAKQGLDKRQNDLVELKNIFASLQRRTVMLKEQRHVADERAESIVASFSSDLINIHQSTDFNKCEEISQAARRYCRHVDQWIRSLEDERSTLIMPTVLLPGPGELTSEAGKIYIPRSASYLKGVNLKGLKLPEKAGGAYWVEWQPGADLSHLDKILPLAYRTNRPEFSFMNLPNGARNQNLRDVFYKRLWFFIRNSVSSNKGGRCEICGGVDGLLLDSVYAKSKRSPDHVECHEVWEFKVLDAKNSIGVQKLVDILLVCRDCHMMFHEDQAVREGKKNNFDTVHDFLEERMSVVTGQDEISIEAQRTSEKEVQASLDNVSNWLMDLSWLEKNSDLIVATPVLELENMANVTPDMIAGLTFEDSHGGHFSAKSVEDVLNRLLEDLEIDQDAVMER
jgi:hypothetical protein